MARQRRMARAKAPRMAPTAMKTVPSGRVEWFMKGALRVGGMVGGGYAGISVLTVLERVGKSVGRTTVGVLVLRPGSGGALVDDDRDDTVRDDVCCAELVEVVRVCCGWLG
jgi:hypothetical protein